MPESSILPLLNAAALAGSAAVYTKNRIERCFRDVHMVTQHGVVGPAGYTLAGRCFLGVATNLR